MFTTTKFSDFTEYLIPFFDKYQIIGVKFEDYQDLKKVAQLMEKKAHLTIEGLEEIRIIKAKMNRGRSQHYEVRSTKYEVRSTKYEVRSTKRRVVL